MMQTVIREGFIALQEKRRDLKLVRQLEKAGNSEALLLAALLRLEHVMNETDQAKVFAAFKRASESGFDDRIKAFSLYYVAIAYEEGIAVRKNRRTAERRYVQSASLGGVNAMFQLARMYRCDERYEQNLDCSLKYYELAANAPAQSQPEEILSDCANLREFIKRADQQVALWAREHLGEAYFTGQYSVPKDVELGIHWLEQAANSGSSRAKRFLRKIRSNPTKAATEIIHAPPLITIDLIGLRQATEKSRAPSGIDCDQAFERALKYLRDPVPNYKYAARYLEVAQQFGKQGIHDLVVELKQQVGAKAYAGFLFGWNHLCPVEDHM